VVVSTDQRVDPDFLTGKTKERLETIFAEICARPAAHCERVTDEGVEDLDDAGRGMLVERTSARSSARRWSP